MTTPAPETIGLVAFDWTGTPCDFGNLARVPFRRVYHDVSITLEPARVSAVLPVFERSLSSHVVAPRATLGGATS